MKTGPLFPEPKHLQNFSLELPFEKWEEFIPGKNEYIGRYSLNEKRDYTILKLGTETHVINEHILEAVKSPRRFVFKRAKVYPSLTSSYTEIRG